MPQRLALAALSLGLFSAALHGQASKVTKETIPGITNCAGGGRAASLWMIKRVQVDKWDEARALEEATALGLNERLKPFALDYIHSHER